MPNTKTGNFSLFVKVEPEPSGSFDLTIKGPGSSCGWPEATDLWASYSVKNWTSFLCSTANGISSSSLDLVVASGTNTVALSGMMDLFQPVYETTGVINSNVDLYTAGPIQSTGFVPLYTEGPTRPLKSIPLYVRGDLTPYGSFLSNISSTSFNAHISGASVIASSGNMDLFLKPEATGTMEFNIPAFIKGAGEPASNSLTLYAGNSYIGGSVPFYINGFFLTINNPFNTIAITKGDPRASINQKADKDQASEESSEIKQNDTVIGPFYNSSITNIVSTWTPETVEKGKPGTGEMGLFIKNVGASGGINMSIPSGHEEVSGYITLFASGATISSGGLSLNLPKPSSSSSGFLDSIIIGSV
jgi:hypothetical protein